MKSLLNTLIISLLLIYSCRNNESNTQEFKKHIVVEESLVAEEEIFKTLVDSLHFIRLESNENCFLSEIDQLFVENDRMYISCENGPNSGIFVFDISGKFLYAINNHGRGPEEFLIIKGFCIQDNVISINDIQRQSILQFNATDGSFIKALKTPFRAFECETEDGYYYFHTLKMNDDDTTVLTITNSDLKIESDYFDRNLNKINWYRGRQLIKGDNRLIWIDQFGKVYSLEKGNVVPLYDFDFGEKTLLAEQYENCKTTADLKKLNKAYSFTNPCISSKLYMTDFIIGGKLYRLHYDISKDKAIYYELLKSTELMMPALYADDHFVYASIRSSVYHQYLDFTKDKNFQNITGIYPDVSLTDNPLIVRKKYK